MVFEQNEQRHRENSRKRSRKEYENNQKMDYSIGMPNRKRLRRPYESDAHRMTRKESSNWRSNDFQKDQNKEKEEDVHRITQRQRQIELGKKSPEYQFFQQFMEAYNKTTLHKAALNLPLPPDPFDKISKRRFDGKIKKWRKDLHQFVTCHHTDELNTNSSTINKFICHKCNNLFHSYHSLKQHFTQCMDDVLLLKESIVTSSNSIQVPQNQKQTDKEEINEDECNKILKNLGLNSLVHIPLRSNLRLIKDFDSDDLDSNC
ncbi:hypothetical protein RFI_14434 [Reticulomyxa filosa]|uniref:Histone RNA hairpin-binding protein RNA-binding domain-containing protein n=1 Tax=Reticulomyxa filosa TaxID=46433 RepID=X6N9P1_RETFI|nr:hypothetical protein RFI_14434 [Reticulomyxa filosa]|eukprot:ETO22756.1 hypothetical protein RFI_14434 [Reticulomyxa filosa]